MLAVLSRAIEPCAIVLDVPEHAVCGEAIPFVVTVRNLGTVHADALVVSLVLPNDVSLVEVSTMFALSETNDILLTVDDLAPGAAARLVGRISLGRTCDASVLALTASLYANATLVGSVVREIVPSAAVCERRAPSEDDARVHVGIADDAATLVTSATSAEPGERIAWHFDVVLAGGIADDYTIDLHGLGCEVERSSVRATYGGGAIVVPTTRRDAVVTAHVAAICGTNGLHVEFVAVVASPHVRGGTVAVEATVARGQRHLSASASVAIEATARFGSVPEAITLLEPLHAGRASRLAIALVNIGTASANGVRVAGSLAGIDGGSVRIAKGMLDDITPLHTEIVDGRIVVPAPLRNGTLVTVVASITANACEPVAIRRVFAVASHATFLPESTYCRLVGDEAVRPFARRALVVAARNGGTDRAGDARVRIALPSWLRIDGLPDDDRPELALGTIDADASAEYAVDVRVAADAPMGTHRLAASLIWDDGRLDLAPVEVRVETRPAFDEAMLVLDDARAREPDDTIAYTLRFTNTGDGACRELCVRAELRGPVAYTRASLTVNGRRVRDVGTTSHLFGAGIMLEDIPVGAAIVCEWRVCVDADVAASTHAECAAMLCFDGGETVALQAAVVPVEPAQAFPSHASALPARLPHVAVAREDDVSAAIACVEPARPRVSDDVATERLLRDYLERIGDARGITAVLDVRVFLPLHDDGFAGDPERDAATRALVRAIDRASIRVRLGDGTCWGESVSSDLAAAYARYRDEPRDAPMAAILLAVLDDLAIVPGRGEVRDAFVRFRDCLKSVFGWWQTRPDEIDDLLNAELPASLGDARRNLIAALGGATAVGVS